MKRTLLAFAATLFASQAPAANWVAGKHYTELPQAQRTSVPAGKVEVMEVFSYGCPACNRFQPVMKKIKATLPANAQIVYLPASWQPSENWPLFQRAYLTAQSLGIADKTHDEMYKAIWDTGELGIVERDGRSLKKTLPSIDDAAKFYQRVAGVKAADFVSAAKSFSVDMKMRQADAQIIAMKVSGTPTLVVNGKYRINNENMESTNDIVALVQFLVAKEIAAKSAASPAPAASKKS